MFVEIEIGACKRINIIYRSVTTRLICELVFVSSLLFDPDKVNARVNSNSLVKFLHSCSETIKYLSLSAFNSDIIFICFRFKATVRSVSANLNYVTVSNIDTNNIIKYFFHFFLYTADLI